MALCIFERHVTSGRLRTTAQCDETWKPILSISLASFSLDKDYSHTLTLPPKMKYWVCFQGSPLHVAWSCSMRKWARRFLWHHFNRFIFNSGIRRSTSNDSNDSNKNNKKYCCQRLCHGSEKFGMLCTHQIWAHATLIKTHNVRNMHHAAGSSDMTFLDWYMQAYDGITITFLYYWYNMSIMFL